MPGGQLGWVSFEKIAFELYGLPLDEFVAARDQRAAAARKEKDRELANSLKELTKPSVGAWAVNQLMRQQEGLVERLLQVGDRLREAQMKLNGERLRELSAERRRLLTNLRRLGVSEGAEQEAIETLGAAVAEATVAAEVRAGRITRGLLHSGFGGLEGMLAAGLTAPPAQPPAEPEPVLMEAEPEAKPPQEHSPEPEPKTPLVEGRLKLLKHRLETADEALQEAQADRDLARERVDSMRERLQKAREKLKAAEEAVRSAEAERDEIQEQLDDL